MKNSTDNYLHLPTGKIWYKRISGGNGVPLVLVHGGPGISAHYMAPLEALASGRDLIFYEQAGCGRSDGADNRLLWRLDHYIEELHQLRKALHLERVHLLGQSWGAGLVGSYALSHPDSGISSLVLSGPLLDSVRWANDQKEHLSHFPVTVRAAVSRAEEVGVYDSEEYQEAITAYYNRHVCRLDPWPDCMMQSMAAFNTELYLYMWGPSEFTVTGTLRNFSIEAGLSKLNLPVLLTCGEFDEASPDTMRHYQAHFRAARLKVFEGCSHAHHLEAEALYLTEADNFLKEVDSAS
ncbi:MAG: proline iminopeptidase-family hydrolase [Bacteroidales bacterium]